MDSTLFRTYKRREVTRRSGFKASGKTTGGQCKIKKTKRIVSNKTNIELVGTIDRVNQVKLFQKNISIIAFGGYIKLNLDANCICKLSYQINNVSREKQKEIFVTKNNWTPIGCYDECDFIGSEYQNVVYRIIIQSNNNDRVIADFYNFDCKPIDYKYFIDNDVYDMFLTKIDLNVPYTFYFSSDEETNFATFFNGVKHFEFVDGDIIVLKSCNRCMRFLPINNNLEPNTISFALHCKKRAPCKHSTFSAYEILESDSDKFKEHEFYRSYYGHQLECKACKKFFVNAPLNPLRDAQQFKEDSLRRRAFEVLIKTLLNEKIVHHAFKKNTDKEFTQYIWEKFDKKCFKCGKPLTINEMNLDHTMPLAYLYPLDETATCLCETHNSSKNDHFPIEFYNEDEIIKLSAITGLSIEKLHSKDVNMKIVNLLVKNVVWFFDEFLMQEEYQKIRKNRLTADKIYSAICRVIPKEIDLILLYKKEKGCLPSSITIN